MGHYFVHYKREFVIIVFVITEFDCTIPELMHETVYEMYDISVERRVLQRGSKKARGILG